MLGKLLIALAFALPAFATTTKMDTKKAETAMMTACKKEFPKEVKGKKTKEVADWVEQEEHGTNSDKFKQTKCFAMHEKWETTSGTSETGETTHDETAE